MGNAKIIVNTKHCGRMLHVGDTVNVNFQGKSKWMSGVLEEQLGSLTFLVQLEDDQVWKKHVYHICMIMLM